MTKARTRWPRQRDAQDPVPSDDGTSPPAAVRPTELETCLRACAAHSGKLVAGLDRRRTALAEALRNLLATHATMEQTPAAASPVPLLRRTSKGGPGSALVLGDQLLDPLLAVGNKALDCGYEDELKLAVLVTDTVLTQRRRSRAAWRLRARVLEAIGAEADAVEAYERYLALTDDDGFGIAAKTAGLRAGAERQDELLRILERDCPEAAGFAEGPVTDTWAEGLALHARGDRNRARSRLIGALLAQDRSGAPVPEIQEALAHYLGLALEADGAPGSGGTPAGNGDPARLTELIELYAGQRRMRMRGPVADPTFGGVEWTTLGEFRNHIAGKSICLIANSQRVGAGSMGAEIDAYDLVVRFNSFRIDPAATGSRTDIHATIHKHGFNWDRKVHTRLVFGGISGDWKHSLRTRLVPGAQQYLGDESLRWPLRDIGKVGTDAWPAIPTSGFNMLWLLDHLDVSPQLDLIGFDFYESGAYRLPAAMKMPITSVHEYTSEKAWVMERAQSVTDTRIRLR
ncbi:helix-turn-helix transcriptional regulator [Streptomyces brevispora]|uniref:helix-turn-helix transcriptional regulator n=1 Tax=Streptomyces brevispora TaxID=887462 RepID=UPI0035E224BF